MSQTKGFSPLPLGLQVKFLSAVQEWGQVRKVEQLHEFPLQAVQEVLKFLREEWSVPEQAVHVKIYVHVANTDCFSNLAHLFGLSRPLLHMNVRSGFWQPETEILELYGFVIPYREDKTQLRLVMHSCWQTLEEDVAAMLLSMAHCVDFTREKVQGIDVHDSMSNLLFDLYPTPIFLSLIRNAAEHVLSLGLRDKLIRTGAEKE